MFRELVSVFHKIHIVISVIHTLGEYIEWKVIGAQIDGESRLEFT